MKQIITYKDSNCIEYDIIVNEQKVAYAIEYKDNSAEIYYDFENDEYTSSYVFDSIEQLEEFIYRNFDDE
jgi:hypothetical protein